MSKRTSKSDKGCIGFVADGVIRKATIYAFKTNDKDPTERIFELQQYFGAVKGKYICVSDVDDVYDKFIEALQEFRVKETPLFSVSITKGNDVLKTVSETTKAHNIKCCNSGEEDDEKQEPEEADEPETKTSKSTKKTSKIKQSDEEADDKTTNKTTTNKSSTKKVEVEEEQESSKSESEEDDEEKNSKPKLKKKTAKTTDESKSKKSKSK